jgi:hypothetical protein
MIKPPLMIGGFELSSSFFSFNNLPSKDGPKFQNPLSKNGFPANRIPLELPNHNGENAESFRYEPYEPTHGEFTPTLRNNNSEPQVNVDFAEQGHY